jgi:hypothetical protein
MKGQLVTVCASFISAVALALLAWVGVSVSTLQVQLAVVSVQVSMQEKSVNHRLTIIETNIGQLNK